MSYMGDKVTYIDKRLLLKVLENMPTFETAFEKDVVRIIRCKDCEHFKKSEAVYQNGNVGVCGNKKMEGRMTCIESDYCSYAEEKNRRYDGWWDDE